VEEVQLLALGILVVQGEVGVRREVEESDAQGVVVAAFLVEA
jgi:hypothetical protein